VPLWWWGGGGLVVLVGVGVVAVVVVVVVVGGRNLTGFPQEVLGSHVTASDLMSEHGGSRCRLWLIQLEVCFFAYHWQYLSIPIDASSVCSRTHRVVVGHLQWMAPEVRAGSEADGRVADTPSDVYMVGGLLYELLTAGTVPFSWLAGNTELLRQRLTSASPVFIPGVRDPVPSLLYLNVLEAAELDRWPIHWCVQADATPSSAGRLAEVNGLMASCLARRPEDRPKLLDLLRRVTALEQAEKDGAPTGLVFDVTRESVKKG
jgi:hypothetical protein